MLSTYEEELYSYFEVMKTIVSKTLFLSSEQDVKSAMNQEEGCWVFLTLDLFQLYGLNHKSARSLYRQRIP